MLNDIKQLSTTFVYVMPGVTDTKVHISSALVICNFVHIPLVL